MTGGFPLAASILGMEPVWASEIEKFPMTVSKYHFPNMKHYGSVCDIKGAEVEPVDIITFGSPCQDLSVAGKRAGMGEGTRSGLFSEAVRIIKEMRDGTNGRYPRFAVWENVPGAFSSNKGEDFRAVVESLAKVAEETVSIPLPKDGRWEPAGLVEGDRWSIAWRTLDAQFWGVPQRRKRIFLVADFRGQCASEIFFERESLLGSAAQRSGGSGEEVTGGVEGGVSRTIVCVHATQDPITAEDRSHALGANSSQAVYGYPEIANALKAKANLSFRGDSDNLAICFEPRSQDGVPRIHESGICPTLNTAEGGQRQPCVYRFQRTDAFVEDTKGSPLAARDCKDGRDLVVTSTVRRLTPTECERLQGFPDDWTEGLSDSARYKALGNSVAIPCVKFVLGCIARSYAKMD